MQKKVYKDNHEDIKIYCPKCHEEMSGWTYQPSWFSKYWIQHKIPARSCWVGKEQIEPIRAAWEKKYKIIEVEEERQ